MDGEGRRNVLSYSACNLYLSFISEGSFWSWCKERCAGESVSGVPFSKCKEQCAGESVSGLPFGRCK